MARSCQKWAKEIGSVTKAARIMLGMNGIVGAQSPNPECLVTWEQSLESFSHVGIRHQAEQVELNVQPSTPAAKSTDKFGSCFQSRNIG